METEEELIFGKFKIGDIVISLTNKSSFRKEGDLFKVLASSSRNTLYYKESTNSSDSKEWRLATKEEKEAYEKGIKNIKDMAPTIFKKGQYIVTLINDGYTGKINYCSKQRIDYPYLKPEIDTKGNKDNDNSEFLCSDLSFTKWRWATKEEKEEYERRGKPFDVTELEKNVQFVVGKWYKFFANSVINYGKVKSITSETLACDPWIYEGYNSSGAWSTKLITKVEEVDVSIPEIQEHLKEGHPDKINTEFKCIPGDIYRVDWTYKNSKYFLIFKSDSSDYKTGKIMACNNERFFNQTGICSSDEIKFHIKEASLEEKQWLERCIKENKWVPMKQKLIQGEIYKCKGEVGSIFVYGGGSSSPYYIGQHLTEFKKGGGNFNTDPDCCDLANTEERTWLQACIKADRFITKEEALKQEYKYHVVECKTQEEWDFVRQNVPGCTLSSKVFKEYEKIGITFRKEEKEDGIGTYCNIEWFEKKNSKIYSFDEWKKEMNINPIAVAEGAIYTSKYTVKLYSSSPWMEYTYSKPSYNKKQGVDHQEPIIIKKINNKKSILVL